MNDDIFSQFEELEQKVAQLPAPPPPAPPPPPKADDYSLQKLAREHTNEALTTILKIMADDEEDGGVRLEAAKQILDRGWGKPTQKSEVKSMHINVHETLKALAGRVTAPPKVSVSMQEETPALTVDDAQVVSDD